MARNWLAVAPQAEALEAAEAVSPRTTGDATCVVEARGAPSAVAKDWLADATAFVGRQDEEAEEEEATACGSAATGWECDAAALDERPFNQVPTSSNPADLNSSWLLRA